MVKMQEQTLSRLDESSHESQMKQYAGHKRYLSFELQYHTYQRFLCQNIALLLLKRQCPSFIIFDRLNVHLKIFFSLIIFQISESSCEKLKKPEKMIIQQNISLFVCLFIFTIIPQGIATHWPPMHHTSPNPCQVGLSSFNMQICFFITREQ